MCFSVCDYHLLCRTIVLNIIKVCNIGFQDKPKAFGTNVKNKYCLNKKQISRCTMFIGSRVKIGIPMNLMPLSIIYIKVNKYGHDCFPLHNSIHRWLLSVSPSIHCRKHLPGQPWKATDNILRIIFNYDTVSYDTFHTSHINFDLALAHADMF